MTRRVRTLALLASLAVTAALSVPAKAAPAPSPTPPAAPQFQHPGLAALAVTKPNALNTGANWIWQNPKPDGYPLFGISCPSATVCYAVGLAGPILKTTDGGATWTQQTTQSGMFAISCADATHCVAVGYSGQVLSTTDGAGWSPTTISNVAALLGVSCASATNCFAVGTAGSIFATTNGGATWSPQTSTTPNYLYAISCPSTTTCYAVGESGTIVGTTNSGGTWAVVGTGGSFLYGISCVSTIACMAVGAQGTVLTTTNPTCCWSPGDIGATNFILWAVSCQPTMCFIAGDDGNVYQRLPLTSGSHGVRASSGANGGLFAISCPTSSTCFAAGNFRTIVTTTNGGTGWALKTGLPSNTLYGVSCPSTTTCFTVGAGGEVGSTSNGGTTWSTQTSGTTQPLESISCSSTTTCVAVGFNGTVILTTTGGATWLAGISGTTMVFNSVSCPSTTACFATSIGANFFKSGDGGATWTSAPLSTATGLTAVSCPSTTVCYVTDANNPTTNLIYKTIDGGATWTQSFNLANDPQAGIVASFDAINCPNSTTCYAAGGSGLIATTSDGGTNWRTDSSPSSSALTGVTCPAAGNCYISSFDQSLLHTTDFGATWQAQAGFDVYSAISCPSTTVCFAVGQNGNASATTTAGAAWSVVQPTGSTDTIRGLSCYGFGNCYAAAGSTLLSTHDAGNTWASHVLGTTDQFTSISCWSANGCLAVGWPAAIYKTADGGTTWALQANSLYGSDNTFLGVSCSGPTWCVVVGNSGIILGSANGTTWTSQVSGATADLWSVSCPAPNTCVAVGSGGVTTTDVGGAWTAHQSVTTNNLRGVSCTLPAVCYAAGWAGTVLRTTDTGTSWMPEVSGTTQNLYGISCPLSFSTCTTVGNGGTVLQSPDGLNWNNVIDPDVNGLRAVYYLSATHVLIAGFGGAILAAPRCNGATLTSNVPPPQSGGTIVTFTASASGVGCSNPLYEYWMWTAATGWVLKQAYSSNPQFVFDTTGMAPGTYTVDAWAEQSGSPLGTNNYETFGLEAWVVGGCDSATLSPNPAPTTGTVMFTATAAGTGCSAPQYQWWLWSPATGWVLKQPYSATATLSLNVDSLANATYSVDVWVRQAGSPIAYETWALSSIPKGACGPTTVSATQTSPQPVGTTINLTAVNTGCTVPNYRYFDYPSQAGVGPNAGWTMLRDYSAVGTFSWDTTNYKPGTQSIVVHVKAATSTNAYDTDGMVSFSLTGCSNAGLIASPGSPQAAGTTVMLTASASGCPTPLFDFWYYVPGTGWVEVQPYSATATYSWNTTSVPPGTYAWVVFVKQQGSANDHDTYALFSDTVG